MFSFSNKSFSGLAGYGIRKYLSYLTIFFSECWSSVVVFVWFLMSTSSRIIDLSTYKLLGKEVESIYVCI